MTVFPSARGSKNRYPAEGASPRGYWYTVWRERSDWTRTSEAKIFRAREEPKIFASPRAQARGVTGSSQRNVYSKSPGTSFRDSCYICSPDWTRTSNPSINSRMLCQLSYGGLFCFRCWFPLQRVITIPGLLRLRNLKCYEVHHFLVAWLVWVVREASTPRYSPATCRTQDIRQVAGVFTRNRV